MVSEISHSIRGLTLKQVLVAAFFGLLFTAAIVIQVRDVARENRERDEKINDAITVFDTRRRAVVDEMLAEIRENRRLTIDELRITRDLIKENRESIGATTQAEK